jgi:hypothetical protein
VRIVYTRQDGGVTIRQPAPDAMRAFCNGGGWPTIQPNDLSRHIDAEIEAGRSPRLAMHYVHALAFGGQTEAEAYAIIRDRDCHGGTGFELWTISEVMSHDRWFRDAWRRSHNGGPIGVDMAKARKIQLKRIKTAADRIKADLELPRWRERIRRAPSPEQLRQVWPRGLLHG